MTVAEVIAALQKMPQDAELLVWSSEGEWTRPNTPMLVTAPYGADYPSDVQFPFVGLDG